MQTLVVQREVIVFHVTASPHVSDFRFRPYRPRPRPLLEYHRPDSSKSNGVTAANDHTSSYNTIGSDKSHWSTADDVALSDAFVDQTRSGQGRDTIFGADARSAVGALFTQPNWNECGGRKTLHQCKARWQRVSGSICI